MKTIIYMSWDPKCSYDLFATLGSHYHTSLLSADTAYAYGLLFIAIAHDIEMNYIMT